MNTSAAPERGDLAAWLDRQDDLINAVESVGDDGPDTIRLDVRTAACVMAVIRAVRREREAAYAMDDDGIDDHEFTVRAITHRGATIAVNAALDNLVTHVVGQEARG